MTRAVRIATRRSRLALWQAEHVAARLVAAHPGLAVSLVLLPHAFGLPRLPIVPIGPAYEIPGFGVLPLFIADLHVGVLYLLGVASLSVYGIVLGGWSSGSTGPDEGG